jgi:hypothetical protein
MLGTPEIKTPQDTLVVATAVEPHWRNSSSSSDLLSVQPVEQKQAANQEQRAGHWNGPLGMSPPYGPVGVKQTQSDDQDRPNPLPTPGEAQYDQDDPSWDQVHEQSHNGSPEAVAFIENVQSKEAHEQSERDGENPWRPEQELLHRSLHDGHLNSTESPLTYLRTLPTEESTDHLGNNDRTRESQRTESQREKASKG